MLLKLIEYFGVLDENILKFELLENSKLEFPVIHGD
jgi:hypothetical protein